MNPKRGYTLFFGVTLLVTWLLWAPSLLGAFTGWESRLPTDALMVAGRFVPSALGFAFTFWVGGRKACHLLFRRGFQFRFDGRWYAYCLLLLPALVGFCALLSKLTIGVSFPQQFPIWFFAPAFIYILVTMGPLGEEFGWRGYALDRLLETTTPLKASIVLGLVWSAWHYPLFLIPGQLQHHLAGHGLLLSLAGYTVYTVLLTQLMTIVHIATKGSVLAALIMHTAANLAFGLVPIIFNLRATAIYLVFLGIVTAYATWLTAPQYAHYQEGRAT